MVELKIKYDPYHMKTFVTIDGKDVTKQANGYEKIHNYICNDIPLQSWIDPSSFEKGWGGLLKEVIGDSGEEEIWCEFFGREIDFCDLKNSLEQQKKKISEKLQLKITGHYIYKDEEVLDKVRKAYKLITAAEFQKILDDELFVISTDLREAYDNLPRAYANAMDDEFRIVFAGMYSSGKSTLINAILGKSILPVRDGTCTSKVFNIRHNPDVSFAKMYCTDEKGEVVVPEHSYTEETLQKAFQDMFPRGEDGELLPSYPEDISEVHISTDMHSLYPSGIVAESMKLVIVDTPGTSSGEGNQTDNGKTHSEITESVVVSDKKEMIVFVTNAIEDKDDSIQDFLNVVDKENLVDREGNLYDQRFLFVLNKADCCNFSGSESWDLRLRTVKAYYNKKEDGKIRTITNPRFFPTSAAGALGVRTNQTGTDLYRSVANKYYYFDEDSETIIANPEKQNYHFDEYCSTSQTIKNRIANEIETIQSGDLTAKDKRKKEIELHSGIVSLEMAIRDYIERYAVPVKIQRLLRTYETIFKETEGLVGQAKDFLESASKEFRDAASRRQEEQNKKKSEQEKKAALENVKKIADAAHKNLDECFQKFEEDSEATEIQLGAYTRKRIDEIQEIAEKQKRNEDILKQVENELSRTQIECERKTKDILLKSNEMKEKIAREVNRAFQSIKKELSLEEISFDSTVAFEKIDLDCINNVKRLKRTEKNPEWEDMIPLFRRIRARRRGISEYREVDDGIDLNELYESLMQIHTYFDASIDRQCGEEKESYKKEIGSLQESFDRLSTAIDTYSQNIANMERKIKDCSLNEEDKRETKRKLESYWSCLRLVRQTTDFGKQEG